MKQVVSPDAHLLWFGAVLPSFPMYQGLVAFTAGNILEKGE